MLVERCDRPDRSSWPSAHLLVELEGHDELMAVAFDPHVAEAGGCGASAAPRPAPHRLGARPTRPTRLRSSGRRHLPWMRCCGWRLMEAFERPAAFTPIRSQRSQRQCRLLARRAARAYGGGGSPRISATTASFA